MTTIFLTDRPKCNAPEVIEAALKKLLPPVLEWLAADGEPDADQDDVLKDLRDCTKWSDANGYRIARDLDHLHGWSPDSELVDILDMWQHHAWDAHDDAVRHWAKENASHLTPQFKVGDSVSAKWGGDVITGKVSKVDTGTARYHVKHKPSEPGSAAIVNFENTQPAIDQ